MLDSLSNVESSVCQHGCSDAAAIYICWHFRQLDTLWVRSLMSLAACRFFGFLADSYNSAAGPSDPAAELSVPASSAPAASDPAFDSSTAEEATSHLAESPRPQQTATAVAGQEQQDCGSSSLAMLSGPVSQEAGTGQPVDSHADKPSAGSLQQAGEPAVENAGDLPEAAAAGQPAAESLLADGSGARKGLTGHSQQSPAEDPFGASGSVNLFSGLDLAADPAGGDNLAQQQPDNLAQQQPDSLAQQPTAGATSGPDAEAVRAAEEQLGEAGLVQRESLEGLDMQGLEDEMLEENSLAELGLVPGMSAYLEIFW